MMKKSGRPRKYDFKMFFDMGEPMVVELTGDEAQQKKQANSIRAACWQFCYKYPYQAKTRIDNNILTITGTPTDPPF